MEKEIILAVSPLPLSGALANARTVSGWVPCRSRLLNEKGPMVLQFILDGHSFQGACALAGVGKRTVEEWIQKGTPNAGAMAHPDYEQFADAYRAVMAVVERELLECVTAAAKGVAPHGSKPNWEAAKYLLQVKFGGTYKNNDVAIEGIPSRIVVIEAAAACADSLGRVAYPEENETRVNG